MKHNSKIDFRIDFKSKEKFYKKLKKSGLEPSVILRQFVHNLIKID